MKVVVRSRVKSQIRVVVLGAALLHSTTGDFYTSRPLYKKPLHQKPSTPEAMQTKEFQTTSTTECEYTRNFLHQRTLRRCQTALRHKKFTPDSEHVCTKNLLHKKTFNTRDALHIFTLHEEFLHQKAFTPEPFYTTRPLYINTNRLHKKRFTQRQFEPNAFDAKNKYTKQLFTTLSFPSKTVCTRSLLTPEAFTPGTCTPCNFHTRRRFQQKFSHQRIFTAKPFKTRDVMLPPRISYMRRHKTPSKFYTKELSRQWPECFYTRGTSHQRAFTPDSLWHSGHNCAFHQNIFTPGGFCLTARSPYSRKRLLQKPFSPKSCYTIGIFYTKKFSIRRGCTAKRDPGLQNANTLHSTGATLDCKTHADQRHPGLQNTSKRSRLPTAWPFIAKPFFIPLPSSQCRENFGHSHLSSDFIVFNGIYTPFVFFGKNRKVQHLSINQIIWCHLHGRCSSSRCTSLFWKNLPTGRRLQRRRPPFRHRPPFWYHTSAILNE